MPHQEIIDYALHEFALLREEKEIPGIAFGLMHKGRVVYSSGLGESIVGSGARPTADTVFRIASMTKSFTAKAILLLRDRGLLTLDSPLTSYLPWAATIGQPVDSASMTIRDLLTMGAGLPYDDPWGDRQESLPLSDFDKMIKSGVTFNNRVNTRFEYSNLGYALLGRVIAMVTGEEFEQFMKREIIEPLEMKASTYMTGAVPDEYRAIGYTKFASGLSTEPATSNGAFTPMGGLHSTVNDLAKWVATFQRNNKIEEQTPYRYCQSVVAKEMNEYPERIIVSAYGFGLFIDEDALLGRMVYHSGGYPGFGSHMRWHPDSGWAIIALGNLTYAPMSIPCTKIIDYCAGIHIKTSKPRINLGANTQAAMFSVNSLINYWDDTVADKWFAENMDLDQPRAERIAELCKLTSGNSNWNPVGDSLTSPTESLALWKMESQGRTIAVDMLMSPEKSPRIQRLIFSRSI